MLSFRTPLFPQWSIISFICLALAKFRGQFLSTKTCPNLLLLLSLMDAQATSETDIPRRGPDVHLIVAAGYLPAVGVNTPIGQRTRRGLGVQRDGDVPGLLGLQLDL